MPNVKRKQPAGPLKLNTWQASALAEAMQAHDERRDPDDSTLATAYAVIEMIDEDNSVLTVKWEDGGYHAIWGDGSDCTNEYPEART